MIKDNIEDWVYTDRDHFLEKQRKKIVGPSNELADRFKTQLSTPCLEDTYDEMVDYQRKNLTPRLTYKQKLDKFQTMKPCVVRRESIRYNCPPICPHCTTAHNPHIKCESEIAMDMFFSIK